MRKNHVDSVQYSPLLDALKAENDTNWHNWFPFLSFSRIPNTLVVFRVRGLLNKGSLAGLGGECWASKLQESDFCMLTDNWLG